MADKTSIQWTDATWNPIRGCSRVSEGCRHCYAERMAARFSGDGQPFTAYALHGRWTGRVDLVPALLDQPLRWRRPRKIFVNSMSDLFHEDLPDGDLDQVFAVMALAPDHTFQVLTKRPERMRAYLSAANVRTRIAATIDALDVASFDRAIDGVSRIALWRENENRSPGQRKWVIADLATWPLPNVWLGVSVENQEAADARIPALLRTPAAMRFLSIEPLLAPVDLSRLRDGTWNALDGLDFECIGDIRNPWAKLGDGQPERGVDWVIVGGESGAHARPMHPQWARDLRDQCVAAGTPFFFKQCGAWAPSDDDDAELVGLDPEIAEHECAFREVEAESMKRVGTKKAGRQLDGREWNECPPISNGGAA